VDDILLAAPFDQLNKILETFNSFYERLQFTLEIGINNRINFLDVTIILDDQKILFDKYEKPTNTGRYINYSQHPLSQKRSIVYDLTDKALLLSHPKFQEEKNLMHVINTLLNNCLDR